MHKLHTLAWIPWRDDENLYGLEFLSDEEEEWLLDEEAHRRDLVAPTGPTTLVDFEGYVACSLRIYCIQSRPGVSLEIRSLACRRQSRGSIGR